MALHKARCILLSQNKLLSGIYIQSANVYTIKETRYLWNLDLAFSITLKNFELSVVLGLYKLCNDSSYNKLYSKTEIIHAKICRFDCAVISCEIES